MTEGSRHRSHLSLHLSTHSHQNCDRGPVSISWLENPAGHLTPSTSLSCPFLNITSLGRYLLTLKLDESPLYILSTFCLFLPCIYQILTIYCVDHSLHRELPRGRVMLVKLYPVSMAPSLLLGTQRLCFYHAHHSVCSIAGLQEILLRDSELDCNLSGVLGTKVNKSQISSSCVVTSGTEKSRKEREEGEVSVERGSTPGLPCAHSSLYRWKKKGYLGWPGQRLVLKGSTKLEFWTSHPCVA